MVSIKEETIMDKCEKCGINLDDNCTVVWKCPECEKAFKVSFSKLHKIQEAKKQKPGQHLIKCSSCGYTLDDGNEKIVCKCSSCGNVIGGNLAYFVGDDNTNNAEINLNNSCPDLIECPECGKKILSDSRICSYCGYPLGEIEEKKDSIKCPECNKAIFPDVDECPFCGYPMKKKLCIPNFVKGITYLRKQLFVVVISIFLFIVLCTVLYVYQGRKHDLDEKSEDGTSILESLDVGMQKEEETVESSINDFFTNLQTGNWEKTQEYLTDKYDYLDRNPFGLSTEDNLKKLFEHYTFTLIDSTVNGEKDMAYVNLEISHPNPLELLDAGVTSTVGFLTGESIEKGFMNKLDDPNLKMDLTTGSLNLIKVDGEWKIKVDEIFESCVYYGLSEETSFDKLAENKKKRAEEESYIREMIDLVDYRIGMMEGYSGKIPGINNISIKNNGDKQIDSLTLGLDFFDENGVELFSREITVLGILDDPILSGYSWKMERDRFFEIENLPSDIDLDQVAVSINDVQLSDSKAAMQKTPEEEYINQYIEITNYHVGMQSGYRGKEPGISDIAIKNNGDKNIAQLTITVYFQDENEKNIAEDSFMIIGSLFGGDTLKANYSWKMENNKYYEFSNLADEVDISRNSIKVTEIKFE